MPVITTEVRIVYKHVINDDGYIGALGVAVQPKIDQVVRETFAGLPQLRDLKCVKCEVLMAPEREPIHMRSAAG